MKEKCMCNFCGKEMDDWDKQQNITIRTRLKYGSEHDGEDVLVRLCNDCLDRILNACMVSPFIESEE